MDCGRPERVVREQQRKGLRNRFLLVLSGAFGPAGGLEMYNRLIIKVFSGVASSRGGRCELVLNDKDSDIDPRYVSSDMPRPRGFDRSKAGFCVAAFARARALRPHITVFGHLNFAPLAMGLKAVVARGPQWFLTYGVEAWRRIDAASRRVVRSADRILSISDHTRREFARRNELTSDGISLLPCALDPFWAGEFDTQ